MITAAVFKSIGPLSRRVMDLPPLTNGRFTKWVGKRSSNSACDVPGQAGEAMVGKQGNDHDLPLAYERVARRRPS